MNKIKKIALGLFMLTATSFTYAQEPAALDSSYTVAFPPDYEFPWDTAQIEMVEAATMDPDIYLLNFDTADAIAIDESFYEVSYIPTASDALIEDRLQCMQGEVPLSYHPRVRAFIDYFSIRNREYTLKIMMKKNIYFPLYEKILKEMGMPDELKYLSIIESALKPRVRSRAGAVGLWQFIPSTGRSFGLYQSYYVDQRMNPEKSTRAACKYLKSLHQMFGDWELAIAAYNCGPGNIRKAKRRSGKQKFWDIYKNLPRETRSYLPQFVAMAYVLSYAEDHNLIQEQPYYAIPSETVYVSQYVNLEAFAKELKVCLEDIEELNPELKRNVVPAGSTNFPLKIPAKRLGYYRENSAAILKASASKASERDVLAHKPYKYTAKKGQRVIHRVRNGETLGHIAERYHVSVSNIRYWNGIRGNLIRVGQKLVIYSRVNQPVKGSTASKPKYVNPQPIPNGKVHIVRSGDTLWDIAKLYEGMTVEKLKKLNKLYSNKLKIGQALRLQ